jgi:hypothetical protein
LLVMDIVNLPLALWQVGMKRYHGNARSKEKAGGAGGAAGGDAGEDAEGDHLEGGAEKELYCTCRGPSFGEMIGCDNEDV